MATRVPKRVFSLHNNLLIIVYGAGKHAIYEGGTRGTAVLYSTALRKRNYTNTNMMHAADWFPTLLTAADIPYDDVLTRNTHTHTHTHTHTFYVFLSLLSPLSITLFLSSLSLYHFVFFFFFSLSLCLSHSSLFSLVIR